MLFVVLVTRSLLCRCLFVVCVCVVRVVLVVFGWLCWCVVCNVVRCWFLCSWMLCVIAGCFIFGCCVVVSSVVDCLAGFVLLVVGWLFCFFSLFVGGCICKRGVVGYFLACCVGCCFVMVSSLVCSWMCCSVLQLVMLSLITHVVGQGLTIFQSSFCQKMFSCKSSL